jgi:hypothetical protein
VESRRDLYLYFNYAERQSTTLPAPVCDSSGICSRLAVAIGTLHLLAAPKPAVRRSRREGGPLSGGCNPTCSS